MKKSKKNNRKDNNILDSILDRHETWKNHRRHTGLKLIRFS
ncbi:MAG: hypothetical protein AAF039_14660 [Bacteroidota bacterium]